MMPTAIWEFNDNPSSFSDYNWDADDLPARKFYLVVSEIGRRLRHIITDPGTARVLRLCEECAEGDLTENELGEIAETCRPVSSGVNLAVDDANGLCWWIADRYKTNNEGVYPAANAFAFLEALDARLTPPNPGYDEVDALRRHPVFSAARARTEREWGEIVRDIYGPNPFRPVACDPSWRTEAVVALAHGMYEARDFAAMPVLADALEDAGCTQPDILAHCRGPGPHVRGCWVVDLVLGKA